MIAVPHAVEPLLLNVMVNNRLFEAQLWWMCHAHICVSEQMAGWLRQHLGLKHVAVLYDRPPNAIFDNMFVKPTVSNEPNLEDSHQLARRHELLLRLGLTDAALFPHLKPRQTAATASSRQINKTVLTEEVLSEKGTPKRRIDSAAFLVSSTSWTPDEDFTILGMFIANSLFEFVSLIEAATQRDALGTSTRRLRRTPCCTLTPLARACRRDWSSSSRVRGLKGTPFWPPLE